MSPTTLLEDFFALDDSPSVRGFHDPSVRWNGHACPAFPMDSVHEIKAILDQWFEEYSEGERIDITEDGRVFIYVDGQAFSEIDRREVTPSELVNPNDPAVKLYSIGAHSWVWMEDPTAEGATCIDCQAYRPKVDGTAHADGWVCSDCTWDRKLGQTA